MGFGCWWVHGVFCLSREITPPTQELPRSGTAAIMSFRIAQSFCNVTVATYYLLVTLFNRVDCATAMFLSWTSTISAVSPKFCFRQYLFWDLPYFLLKYSMFLWDFREAELSRFNLHLHEVVLYFVTHMLKSQLKRTPSTTLLYLCSYGLLFSLENNLVTFF